MTNIRDTYRLIDLFVYQLRKPVLKILIKNSFDIKWGNHMDSNC